VPKFRRRAAHVDASLVICGGFPSIAAPQQACHGNTVPHLAKRGGRKLGVKAKTLAEETESHCDKQPPTS
jgi:hypothetical protein